MPKQKVIDSHIHLWPAETSNEQGHTWMTSGHPLAKPHLLEDYLEASQQKEGCGSDVEVEGVVYVETDVRYDNPKSGTDVATWAKGPLDEISFLRRIVGGEYGERESRMLLGIVPWAPMDQPTSALNEYLALAEERAGQECWRRVKGFRFLLQLFKDRTDFEQLVLEGNFINNLKELGRRGFSFDVGVDQRSGGIFQLEFMAEAMRKAHDDVDEDQKVTFIVNHLCKPPFDNLALPFTHWREAITAMSKVSKTYIKLSGAFSELPAGFSPDVDDITEALKPWVLHAVRCFGAKRIMFGSDWPVCNVAVPFQQGSWVAWKEVVISLLQDSVNGLSNDDQNSIWRDTAREAYRL